jgi:hypothetical protein
MTCTIPDAADDYLPLRLIRTKISREEVEEKSREILEP